MKRSKKTLLRLLALAREGVAKMGEEKAGALITLLRKERGRRAQRYANALGKVLGDRPATMDDWRRGDPAPYGYTFSDKSAFEDLPPNPWPEIAKAIAGFVVVAAGNNGIGEIASELAQAGSPCLDPKNMPFGGKLPVWSTAWSKP